MLENTISTKFKNTSANKMNLLMAILDNESLRKWIYYLTDNPDNEPDVPVDALLKKNIALTKFNPDIIKESKVIILIDPVEGVFNFNLPSVENWAINVIMPNEFWFMEQYGKERIFEIAHLIAQSVDDQRLTGLGKVLIKSYKTYNINQTWTALTLFAEVVNTNIPINK